jgi:hypothetical protein
MAQTAEGSQVDIALSLLKKEQSEFKSLPETAGGGRGGQVKNSFQEEKSTEAGEQPRHTIDEN